MAPKRGAMTCGDSQIAAELSLQQQFCRDIERINPRDFSPSEAFIELSRRLKQKYPITRGALILKDKEHLSAVSTWNHGFGADGLIINLPENSSLFRQVVDDGRTYAESFIGGFSGNFFEQKLLLDEDTQAFVLQPLKVDGKVIGLLGYSSEDPDAFALFEDGTLDEVADSLAAKIASHRRPVAQ